MTLIDDQPWFVAKDVCSVLFDGGSVRMYGASPFMKHIDSGDRRVVKRKEMISLGLVYGDARSPSLTLISESGLYKLVMRSDKPQAKEFQNWVTKVVLPAIRKGGG